MGRAAFREQTGDVDLSLRFFENPYSRLHLFHGGRPRTRVLELEVQQWSVTRHAFLLGWHIVEVFAVPCAERGKYYIAVPTACRDMEQSYALGVHTAPVLAYFSEEVLKGSPSVVLAMLIAMTEFVVSTLVCFVRCTQYGTLRSFMAPRMRAAHYGHSFLLPLPDRMWHATDGVGILHVLDGCEVDVPKALIDCACARKINWRYPRHIGWFPYYFEDGKIRVIPSYEVPRGIRGRKSERRCVTEAEVSAMYLS